MPDWFYVKYYLSADAGKLNVVCNTRTASQKNFGLSHGGEERPLTMVSCLWQKETGKVWWKAKSAVAGYAKRRRVG